MCVLHTGPTEIFLFYILKVDLLGCPAYIIHRFIMFMRGFGNIFLTFLKLVVRKIEKIWSQIRVIHNFRQIMVFGTLDFEITSLFRSIIVVD